MAESPEQLAHNYLVGELGLDPQDVPEATQNLLGYFRTLHAIQERLQREEAV